MSSPSPPNPYWKGPTPVSNSNSSEEHSNSNVSLIVGVVVGVGLFLVFVLMLGAFFIKKKKKKKKPHDPMQYYADSGPQDNGYYSSTIQSKWLDGSHPPTPGGGWQQHAPQATIDDNEVITAHSGPRGAVLPPPSPLMALGYNDSTFTYEELAHATNGFSEANLLGQGGFGYVHKGVLPNGKEIAVKQLKAGSGQGEREFQAEVDTISRVHHRHLVSLIGYCISGAQRILIYEFVPNNNLEYHLHGEGIPPLDWSTRIKIALGAAKGIAFLHEDCHPRIIHRDIKAANILLDDKFEAMVADFGLAKLSPDNFTHISTRVMGTFGYLAPEYASSGKLTEKSDVFSYGVMLLELITGQRPVESEHTSSDDGLVDWARQIMPRAMVNGNYNELIDPRLQNKYDAVELVRMVVCAAACIRHSAKRRPKMSQIVRALEGDLMLDELNEGVKPSNSMVFSSSSDYESSSNNSNANFFKKHATSSPDHSGEYSCSLDENVRHPSMSSSDGVVVSGELNAVLNHTNRPQKQV